jgi:hypothetical protein
MNREKLLEERRAELKPLIFCLQTAIELYGRDKAKELAQESFEKYAEDRFVRGYDIVPENQRWRRFKEDIEKLDDGTFYTVAVRSERMIKIKYVWCTFLEVFKEYGLEDFVPLYCDTDYRTCQKIHPGIKMTRTKTLADGDDHCDHCWTYEGP